MRFPLVAPVLPCQVLSRLSTAACALTVTACSLGAPDPIVYDFVERRPFSQPLVEREVIDIGTPDARPLLVEGWHDHDERWARRTPFVWGVGDQSVIELPLVARRPLTLVLRGRPMPASQLDPDAGAPAQVVTIVVNGWIAGNVSLEEGFQSYRLDVPETMLRVGHNRVELRYLFNPRTAGYLANPRDSVRRAVAWARVRLEDPRPPAPAAEPIADGLRIPFGTGVEYVMTPPPGSVLSADALSVWGDATAGHLEVRVATDDAEREVFELRSGGWRGPTPIPLPDLDPLDPVRITLLARAEGGESDGGIELTRPVLRAAPEPTAPVLPPEADARLSALREAGRGRPPVLIYLIDTLRADHLGSYGYHLDTSPNLDAFADDAVRFSRSTAQSGWTRTSVASIFTGLHPRSHDVNDREDMMSSSAVTLATVLRANGYDTTGFITNGNVAATFGLDHGFDTYVYLRERKTDEIHVQSDELNERALGWLEARDVDRPFFLYLHSVDPHDPYTPRSPFRERFIETQQFPELATLRNLFRTPAADRDVPALSQELTALYDAEIAFNDHHFGELIRWLKANALYEQTLLLVMSDHGEAFYEHGRWGHGNSLYQELISVPLLVKLPGQVGAGLVIDEPAQHVDAMPTILDLLDIPIPDAVQGRSLLPAVASGQVDPTTQTTAYLQLDTRHLESVQTIRRKLIRHPMSDRTGGRVELYDLVDDPFELQDLAGTRAVARRHLMVELMEAALARPTLLETSEAVIDAELEDRLRALGYVR